MRRVSPKSKLKAMLFLLPRKKPGPAAPSKLTLHLQSPATPTG